MTPAKGGNRESLLVVGPSPPPSYGVSMMTVALLDAVRAENCLADHVDTSDRRDFHLMGSLDLRNAWLGLVHATRFLFSLARYPHAAVFVPISQGKWGFLRDAAFLVPARLVRRRRWVQLHGGALQEFHRACGPLMRLVVRIALGGAHRALALTPALATEFDGLVPATAIRVLPNTVEDRFGSPSVPKVNTGIRVLYVANIFPGKGADVLMAAAELLREHAESMEFRLAGAAEPSVAKKIQASTERLAKRGVRVVMLGALGAEELANEYGRADVFVFPPDRAEGQPLVLLEALAAGLPIITTRFPGIADTVRDGFEGLLVEPGDATALAGALGRLVRDPTLRGTMGEAARARYESEYTPERFQARIALLLREGSVGGH